MDKNTKIYVAGHHGLVGSAIWNNLQRRGYTNLVGRSHKELDLLDGLAVKQFFDEEQPDAVVLAAAHVGGILANLQYRADFIYQNLQIQQNVIGESFRHNVKKLLFLGSTCIYPRNAAQPMKEDALLTSELEATNEAYAIAKIAAIKLCRYYNQQYGTNYISVMPTNQYGAGDNFNMETAHLLPMLMRRFHLAKLLRQGDFEAIRRDLKKYRLGWGLDEKLNLEDEDSIVSVLAQVGAYKDKAVVWGDGSVFREMMDADDLADACFYLMQNKDAKDIGELVNITDGTDIQLKNLIELTARIVGYDGKIEYDTTKPNGTPRKMMDATRIKALGWSPKIRLEDGIARAYRWYVENTEN